MATVAEQVNTSDGGGSDRLKGRRRPDCCDAGAGVSSLAARHQEVDIDQAVRRQRIAGPTPVAGSIICSANNVARESPTTRRLSIGTQ